MTDPTVTCPKCKTKIKLTEAVAAPLIEVVRREYDERLAEKDDEVSKREKQVRQEKAALAKARAGIADEVADRLREERPRILAEEARKAKLALGIEMEARSKEMAELRDLLKKRDVQLGEAQEAQASVMKKERELEDAKRALNLTIEKQVQAGLTNARELARKEAEDGLGLRIMEKDQTISSLHKTIEELNRKVNQGSEQLQGEVQELQLEAILREKFPADNIVPVPKGEYGGDVVHETLGPGGRQCGKILWESKRTKSWSDAWLPKLREDQRSAKADIAIIVTRVLPKGLSGFGLLEDVWVTSPELALPLAVSLRQGLLEVATARLATQGQQTKMELVYQYMTSPRFRLRVQAIVEAFTSMREELEKERKVITKQWSKREEQIERVLQGTVGMYGDLQGIAGSTLPEIEGLELKALEGPSTSDDGGVK